MYALKSYFSILVNIVILYYTNNTWNTVTARSGVKIREYVARAREGVLFPAAHLWRYAVEMFIIMR